jgi:hypothetical protein
MWLVTTGAFRVTRWSALTFRVVTSNALRLRRQWLMRCVAILAIRVTGVHRHELGFLLVALRTCCDLARP